MPQVPYTGVPSVAPGGTPQSRFHADVSETTFGGNVGAAMSSLGGTLQRSGNELFERGHRLVADDIVNLTRKGRSIIGKGNKILGHHMEIRGDENKFGAGK
jgi:HPr kinase/phosphorylase